GEALLDATLPVSQLLHRQLTLSWQGATVEDEILLNLGGGLGEVPLYLVRLRPVLLLDGRPLAVGQGEADPAQMVEADFTLIAPAGDQDYRQQLQVGAPVAVGIDAQGDRPPPIDPQAPHAGEGPVAGAAARVLGHFASRYAEAWNLAD